MAGPCSGEATIITLVSAISNCRAALVLRTGPREFRMAAAIGVEQYTCQHISLLIKHLEHLNNCLQSINILIPPTIGMSS